MMGRVNNIQCREGRGFTLLEVLIALGLAGALLFSAFSFYFNLLSARQRLIGRADQQRAAAVIIDQLEANLTTCIVGSDAGSAGVRGNVSSLTIASRAVAANLAERGIDDPAVLHDLQFTEYTFDEQARTIAVRRWSAIDDGTAATQPEILTQRIAKMRFRYYDGSAWNDTFNSAAADALPLAVELAIWFDASNGSETAKNSGENDEFAAEGEMAGFDDFAFAMRDDRGFEREPLPDRFRIIAVHDAGGDEPRREETSVEAEQ